MHRLVRPPLFMRFYYVYILKSINHNFIYVGFTQDLKIRLKQHNNKEELSTKAYAPYNLIHYEAYKSEKDAKRREIYLKTTKGKTTLRYMLRDYLNYHKKILITSNPVQEERFSRNII
jgi:putative endonuclease